MIKKFIGVVCGVLCAGWCFGVEMDFVTVLTSPIGSFSSLETASSAGPVRKDASTGVPVVNFCNTRSSTGTITLQGQTGSQLGAVNLVAGTGITGNITVYQAAGGLLLNNEGLLDAKAIMADTVNLQNASSAQMRVEGTMQMIEPSATMTVQGAKADRLYLGTAGSNGQITASATSMPMQWSNVYTTPYDYNGGSISARGTYVGNQYLLKGRVPPSLLNSLDAAEAMPTTTDAEATIDP